MAGQHPVLVILAGGASSRMWPLREKSLIRFGDEPLLVWQLRRYAALGLNEVVIVANPENEAIIKALTAPLTDLSILVTVQAQPRGMGDALLAAAPLLPPDVPLMVVQVHDVTDAALPADLLAAFNADPTAAYLTGNERADYFPGGYLIVNGDRITGIVEKPGADNRPSNLVNVVAHIHPDSSRLLAAIRAEYASTNPADDHYERAMAALMRDQVFRVVRYSGAWRALKYPWHTLDIMEYFLAQLDGQTIHPSAFIADTARISGSVVIGEGARIFPGAAIVGPAYIGKGVIVGNNALVRASMVLDGSNVGFTTEVARSYVADHCDMHACRVLDSVFAPRVNFSAGCTTANLRIDRGDVRSRIKGDSVDTARGKLGAIIGEGAFLAVDVMTMPGVKIGEYAQVGPGTHVHQDVPSRARVYVKQTIVIEED